MTTLIIGGTGFIGRRLIPLLEKQGEDSVVMDINPQTANFSGLAKVRVLRGDVSQDSVANMQWQTVAAAKAKDRWERNSCGASPRTSRT